MEAEAGADPVAETRVWAARVILLDSSAWNSPLHEREGQEKSWKDAGRTRENAREDSPPLLDDGAQCRRTDLSAEDDRSFGEYVLPLRKPGISERRWVTAKATHVLDRILREISVDRVEEVHHQHDTGRQRRGVH